MRSPFPMPIEIVKERLFKKHGDQLSIKESSYKKVRDYATFVDKDHGKWTTRVDHVLGGCKHPNRRLEKTKVTCQLKYGHDSHLQAPSIKNKIRKTCLKNHGVLYPSQNKDIYKKCQKSQRNSGVIKHWKTNEDCIWQANYERKTLEWLNNNQVEFEWQPKTFKTSVITKLGIHSLYTPDLYLIDKDLWVEIKGYFMQQISENKWNWFHKKYPNSELWMSNKLKELGIL